MNLIEKDSIFIFASELSGDMHGARLVKALKKRWPDQVFHGVGGTDLRAQGVVSPWRSEDFGVMGFSDVLFALPGLLHKFMQIRDYILKTAPLTVIFIDSASFSLRMARELRKRGFKGKLVQYISPTVWAWGKNRIEKMEAVFDLLLTIYPFEKAYFSQSSLKVEYIGNPVKEAIDLYQYDVHWKRILGIKETEHLVGLFPGSRVGEIKRNLPSLIEAAQLLKKQYPEAVFALSCAHGQNDPLIHKLLKKSTLRYNQDLYFIPRSYNYELMRGCRSAIAKSGTVTLELALHGCPTVVLYKLSWLNKWIAKNILRVNLSHYCIVNILGNKTIFPELIEHQISSDLLYQQLLALHQPGNSRESCLAECRKIDAILTEKNVSERAASAIEDLLS